MGRVGSLRLLGKLLLRGGCSLGGRGSLCHHLTACVYSVLGLRYYD